MTGYAARSVALPDEPCYPGIQVQCACVLALMLSPSSAVRG